MGRPKKYTDYDIYAPQRAYFKSEKGKKAVKRYNSSESAKILKREWARANRGTIVDKQQWFIDNYGDPEKALVNLEDEEEREAIELYYGLTGSKPINQTAIAKILKKSQPKVSQIIRDARKKLTPLEEPAFHSSQDLIARSF